MTSSNGRTLTSTTVGLSLGDSDGHWKGELARVRGIDSWFMVYGVSKHTSLASNGGDERGDAEEDGGGTHVDVDDVVWVM